MDNKKENIISELQKALNKNTREFEYPKAKLFAECSEELSLNIDLLNKNVKEFIATSNSLSRKIYFLNIILTIATAVVAFIGVISARHDLLCVYHYFIK